VRRGRRLPLSWGKGRSRAAAQRRKIRYARGFLAAYDSDPILRHMFRTTAAFGAHCAAVRLTRDGIRHAMVDSPEIDAEVERRLDLFRRAARYATYCEMAR
jgi:hypothetical protein